MLNKIQLIGRIGRSPELRASNTTPLASFSLATDEKYKDQKHTEWHQITCFGKTAENATKYLTKGSLVYVEGRVRSEKYQGKDGTEKTAYKILADTIRFLDSKKSELQGEVQSHVEGLRDNVAAEEVSSFDDDSEIPF